MLKKVALIIIIGVVDDQAVVDICLHVTHVSDSAEVVGCARLCWKSRISFRRLLLGRQGTHNLFTCSPYGCASTP